MSAVLDWDRCGDGVVCLFTGQQVRWMRDAMVGYRDRVDSALAVLDHAPQLVQVRGVLTALLGDLSEHDNVVVFRNEGHRIAWAWILDALRATRAATDRPDGEESRWLFELIDFLLTASERHTG